MKYGVTVAQVAEVYGAAVDEICQVRNDTPIRSPSYQAGRASFAIGSSRLYRPTRTGA
jgi:hypothetical protein